MSSKPSKPSKSSNEPEIRRAIAQFSRPFRKNRWGRPAMGVVYFLAAWPVRWLLILLMRREYQGAENLPKRGGFIAVSNHVTELDSVTFGHFLLANHVSVRIMVKETMMHWPVVGFCAKHSRMIPVFRESAQAKDSLIAARAALQVGEVVGMFPEGTLTRDPGLWPMKPRTGAARLALETRVPVIPVAQWGAHRTLEPYGKWRFPPRGRVRVIAGPPVDLADLYGRFDDHEAITEAAGRISQALTGLIAQMRPGETPPEKLWDMKRDGDRYHRDRHRKGAGCGNPNGGKEEQRPDAGQAPHEPAKPPAEE
ncbi:1-acyl-sn-glycerol-3-phosphate acyltransferase [Mobiluncus mulieris]|uniref:2-acyl-glycerophospho-ethanolamine acyltransferase n=1 Tax=Mobiluncus mulieris TaxID=2052 RepID=A0A8G2HTW1_9ACTO|nr:lysophospholipid acyltransferase family protein [Mobiluncus mulieris]MBB5846675.1 1-acyl-sn-glycerol-3-phosphate acyltransferase [Mobiluncus mulieris]STO16853.1 2-acyl-glycerophospho-ethanolamine acyltransferase [Mobiluncus mulieris]